MDRAFYTENPDDRGRRVSLDFVVDRLRVLGLTSPKDARSFLKGKLLCSTCGDVLHVHDLPRAMVGFGSAGREVTASRPTFAHTRLTVIKDAALLARTKNCSHRYMDDPENRATREIYQAIRKSHHKDEDLARLVETLFEQEDTERLVKRSLYRLLFGKGKNLAKTPDKKDTVAALYDRAMPLFDNFAVLSQHPWLLTYMLAQISPPVEHLFPSGHLRTVLFVAPSARRDVSYAAPDGTRRTEHVPDYLVMKDAKTGKLVIEGGRLAAITVSEEAVVSMAELDKIQSTGQGNTRPQGLYSNGKMPVQGVLFPR